MPSKRIAIVTGGNRGIGHEIARQLAKADLFVVIGAPDKVKCQNAVSGLKGRAARAHAHAHRGSRGPRHPRELEEPGMGADRSGRGGGAALRRGGRRDRRVAEPAAVQRSVGPVLSRSQADSVVRRRALRLLAVAAAGLVLASCSLTRLVFSNVTIAYNNATPVIAWMVDDYVDLTEPQKDWGRDRLSRTIAWHRGQGLPEYRRFFEKLSAQVADNVSVEEARTAHREVRGHYRRLLEHMLPDMAELLLQLDADQIAQVERKFSVENRKIVKESVDGTPEKRSARRARRYFEQLEEWTGRLNASQRELIASRLKTMPEHVEERLAERGYRQAGIVALARSRPAREQAIAELRRLVIEAESWRRPEYQQKVRERDEQLFEMISPLSQTLSANQRARLQQRLRSFMRDITELTASS